MRRQGFHWVWVILAVCFVDLFVNYSIRALVAAFLMQRVKRPDEGS